MTKDELIKRRIMLEQWLTKNYGAGTWDDVKDEFNDISYKISELEVEVTPREKMRVAQEHHILTNR